jgi:hypothetical protein
MEKILFFSGSKRILIPGLEQHGSDKSLETASVENSLPQLSV